MLFEHDDGKPKEPWGPEKWMRKEAFWEKVFENVVSNVLSAAAIAYLATGLAYMAGADLPKEFRLGLGLVAAANAGLFLAWSIDLARHAPSGRAKRYSLAVLIGMTVALSAIGAFLAAPVLYAAAVPK